MPISSMGRGITANNRAQESKDLRSKRRMYVRQHCSKALCWCGPNGFLFKTVLNMSVDMVDLHTAARHGLKANRVRREGEP
jgi:hypothetical protein